MEGVTDVLIDLRVGDGAIEKRFAAATLSRHEKSTLVPLGAG
jgi:hypothetical protein